MCTLAWGSSGTGLWVCFNRDEQRSRTPAERPRLHPGPNGPLAYARDPDGGGTWLAAAPGFAVALLNAYPRDLETEVEGRRSRGKLVCDLAGCGSAEAAFNALADESLDPYAPFYLLLFKPDSVAAFAWDGSALSFPVFEDGFVSTSSVEPETIVAWRRDWWRLKASGLEAEPARAGELLRTTFPDRPAYGVTMDRADARTVSQSVVELSPDGFTFTYRAREANGPGFGPPQTLQSLS
jgi:hypothetical protein